ncbi:uncharacterized protein PG998_009566 [Apiospora kogelbergensis]|uniref:uncharacterized protein n=1 Tax=Apiospora kogelbergensis TaxID=1337665 RepID=UPI0031317F3A
MSLTHQRPSPLVIPELLEAILLHVDELTLLVSAQRVSKHWHAVIAVSPRLQWKLFLRPDESAAAAREPQQNPFLAKAFPFCFDPRVVGRLMVFEPKPGNRPILWAKSNILAARPPVLELHRADFWYHFPQCPRLWARQAAFARPDASWRRMLVHQPPVFLSNVLTPMWQGLPLSWIQLKETGASSTSGGPGEGPSSPCQMQDLLRSIFREFSASHDKSNTLTCFEVDADNDADNDEEEEPRCVAGFKVIWDLQGPAYRMRRRALEMAYEQQTDGGSKSGVPRQHVLVLHDVELRSVAPRDRDFGKLKQILFPS